MPQVFALLIFFLLALDGFGVHFGREATITIVILIFPILFIHMLFRKRVLVFPKIASIFFLLYVSSTLISTAFSVDIIKSIQYSLISLSLFVAFLLSYNYKNELEKPITVIIFASSVLFSIYHLLLTFRVINLFIPQHGYQFVYSRYLTHNHLGDFLVLPIVISIFSLYNQKRIILALTSTFLFGILLLFAFSRSAYLSVALTTLVMHLYSIKRMASHLQKKALRISVVSFLLFLFVLFISTTQQATRHSLPSQIHSFLIKNVGLNPNKEDTGRRPDYFLQGLLSVQKSPLIGIGPDNFIYASRANSADSNRDITLSAHNILLEVLVGQGLLGAIPFFGLIAFFIIHSRKTALFFAFLAMLINFQTDYTYQIYSFLLLFVVILGTIVSKDHEITLNFKK